MKLAFLKARPLSWFEVGIFRNQDFQFSVVAQWIFSLMSLTSQHCSKAF